MSKATLVLNLVLVLWGALVLVGALDMIVKARAGEPCQWEQCR